MTNQNELMAAGLPKKLATNLIEQGVPDIATLCGYTLSDLETLEGVGPKALLQIAKIKEKHQAPATSEPAAPQAKPGPKYQFKEPPAHLATKTTTEFTTVLKARHALWIKNTAALYGITEAQVIANCVVQAYARDHDKAGTVESSGTVLKHDNPHAQ